MSSDSASGAESLPGRGDPDRGSAGSQTGPAIAAVAALACALLAGYVLAGGAFPHAPVRVGFSFVGDPGSAGDPRAGTQMRWAPGVGLLVALVVCAVLRAARNPSADTGAGRRPPVSVLGWLTALVGALAMLGLIPMSSGVEGTAHWAMAAAAGMLLGGAAVATHGSRWGVPAIIAGVVAACVMALPAAASWAVRTLLQGSGLFLSADSGGEGPGWWWVPAFVAVAVLAAAVLDFRAARAVSAAGDSPRSDHGQALDLSALGPSAVAVLLVAGGYGAYALAGIGDGHWGWLSAGLIAAIIVVAACAVLLGDGGRVLPAALAVTAVSAPLVSESIPTVTLGTPIVVSTVVLAAVAAFTGTRWPSVGLGFAQLLLAGLLGIVSFGDPQTLLVFRMLLTAVGGAYLLASCLRIQVPESVAAGGGHGDRRGGDGSAWSTVVVSGALFVVSAPAALAEAVGGNAAPVAVAGFGGAGASIGIGVAMTLVVLGCACAYGFATFAGRFRMLR